MQVTSDKKTLKAQKIARAALGLFARKGYTLTSIELISAKAGIGKSTVYEYYDTKEELFVAAIMEAADQWASHLEAVGRETSDPLQRLIMIGDWYIDKSNLERRAESRLFIEVLSQTFLQDGVFYDRPHLIRNLHQRMVRIIVDYLLAGISRGQLRPDMARDAKKITINFLAYLDGIHLHCLIEPGYIDIRDQITLFLNQLAQLITMPPQDSTPAPTQQSKAGNVTRNR